MVSQIISLVTHLSLLIKLKGQLYSTVYMTPTTVELKLWLSLNIDMNYGNHPLGQQFKSCGGCMDNACM